MKILTIQKIGNHVTDLSRHAATVLERHPIGFGTKDLPRCAIGRLSSRLAEYRKLRLALANLKHSCFPTASFDEMVEAARSNNIFHSNQKRTEILGLLHILERHPPRYVCEIGTASGGTLFLLAKACSSDALIMSIDIGLTFERSLVHSHIGAGKQQLIPIRADSRAPETIRRVRSFLRGHELDLLFIDGDHSYDAVKADFSNYGPLVRAGGLIAFHDILPDFRTRFGTPTESDTGEVPRFWAEVKQRYKTTEIIEDGQQDGYGIGIVQM